MLDSSGLRHLLDQKLSSSYLIHFRIVEHFVIQEKNLDQGNILIFSLESLFSLITNYETSLSELIKHFSLSACLTFLSDVFW